MITCQICQHENPEGAEYCENCGAALSTASTPAAPGAEPVAPSPEPVAPTPEPAAPSPEPVAPTPEPVAASQEPTPLSPMPAPGEGQAAAAGTPAVNATAAPSADGVSAADDASISVASAATPSTPSPASAGANPRLVAHRYGATSSDEYPLLGDRLVVGRFDPETGPVDIDLSQTPEAVHISRHHAELYREADGRWYVKDLGATNGVFVRSAGSASFGPRLTAPQALTPGDEIAFGNARFILKTD